MIPVRSQWGRYNLPRSMRSHIVSPGLRLFFSFFHRKDGRETMKKSALKRHPSYDHPKNCRWLLGYSLRREKELTKNSGTSAGKCFLGISFECKFCLSAMIQATSWNYPTLGIGAASVSSCQFRGPWYHEQNCLHGVCCPIPNTKWV